LKWLLATALLVGSLAPVSAQTTLAKWTFETSAPTTAGPLAPEEGAGSAISNTGATFSTPVGWGSSRSWSSNGWGVGEYFQFQTSSTGSSGITVSWQQVGSNTGPKNFRLEYGTDGTSFITHQAYVVNAATWTTTLAPAADQYTFNLSAITALNNAPAIYFRLTVVDTVAINNGVVAATGTGRVDNFTITTAPPAGTPLITVGSSLPAFTAFLGTPSPSQSFLVVGANLTAAINLAAPSGFEVSSDGTTFGSSASLPSTGGTGYARVAASGTLGPVSGGITLTSTGAAAKSVSLTGTVNDPNVLTLTLSPTSIPENSVTPAVGTVSIPTARAANLDVTLVNSNPAAATITLTTVTITAGQLSATFNATPIPDPLSFLTKNALITASAAGLTEGTATLRVTNVDVAPITVISLTASPYTQNFDSLGTSAFNGAVSSTTGTQASLGAVAAPALNGWYVTKIAGTGTDDTSISPDDGTLLSGSVYNYGAADAADRALGLLASGSNTMAMGALITNNTSGALTSLSLSMTAEFWRSSTLNQNTLTFGYGKVAGAITTTNFLSVVNAGVLPLPALNVVGPPAVSSNGPLDGNTLANQIQFNNVSLPIALAPGETVFIRWQDVNDGGNDAALAIDSLIITDGSSASSGYALWIDGFFPGITDPLIIGFNADPDKDGIPNGVEALIGGNPNSPGVFATTDLIKEGNTFTFHYPQDKSVPFGVTASYEWSTDLANWQATGVPFGGVTVTLTDTGEPWDDTDPEVDIYEVTATVTQGTAAKLFVRVVAKN
jgi:hypothetical protein